jgi:hypothetical protein
MKVHTIQEVRSPRWTANRSVFGNPLSGPYRYLEGTGISLKNNGVLFLRTTRVRYTAMWYHRGGGLLGEE